MCIGLKMGILVLDFNSLDKFQAFKHRFILFVILIFSKRPDDYMYIVFDITCIFI